MFITKIAKRLMATVMTAALVLTGFVVAPKEVSAAEDTEPTVEVLGATLRFDGNEENCQSMRVGIQVKNASKAKECGIKLSVGEKTLTVSTDDEKYRNIYAYDADNDTITYTAVIQNIPSDNFKTDISVQGTTTAKESVEGIKTDVVTKNISGIVTAMKTDFPDIDMTANGLLYKNNPIVELKADSSIIDSSMDGLNSFRFWEDSTVSYNKEDKCFDVETGTGKGLGFQTDWQDKYVGPLLVKAEVKAPTGTTLKLKDWNNRDFQNEVIGNGEWQLLEQKIIGDRFAGYFVSSTEANKTYSIKSYEIYPFLTEEDLPSISPTASKISLSGNNIVKDVGELSGEVEITDNGISFTAKPENNGSGITIYLRSDKCCIEKGVYNKIKIIATAERDNTPILISARKGSASKDMYTSLSSSEQVFQYNLSDFPDGTLSKIVFKFNTYGMDPTSDMYADTKFTIKSIELLE